MPDEIRRLPKLTILDVSENPIEHVPDIPGLILDGDAFLAGDVPDFRPSTSSVCAS